MRATTYLTIGIHHYPVHARTYQKGDKTYASYRVRLTKDIDPATGRRKEEDVTAPTLEALEHKLRERLHPYDHLLNPNFEHMAFADLTEQWYEAGCTSWEQSTQRSYRRTIDLYHLPLTRGLRVSDITPAFLQDLYQRLLLAGVSAGVVRRIHALFRAICAFAVQRHYTFSNPCDGLFVPKPVFRLQEALSLEQQRRLLRGCANHEHGPLFATLLASGMRISEALGLTWQNVDFDNGCLRVVATLERRREGNEWRYRLRPYNKNRRHRTVFLTRRQMGHLRTQRERQLSCRALVGKAWDPVIEDLAFTDDLGLPLAYAAVERRFKRLVATLGDDMADVHLHTLRHTAASNFYHATKDVLLTKEFLGHADVRTTELYTHSRPEDLVAIARMRDADPEEASVW